jgi:hypothetical protein
MQASGDAATQLTQTQEQQQGQQQQRRLMNKPQALQLVQAACR